MLLATTRMASCGICLTAKELVQAFHTSSTLSICEEVSMTIDPRICMAFANSQDYGICIQESAQEITEVTNTSLKAFSIKENSETVMRHQSAWFDMGCIGVKSILHLACFYGQLNVETVLLSNCCVYTLIHSCPGN